MRARSKANGCRNGLWLQHHRSRRRRLFLEVLEDRLLLAADLGTLPVTFPVMLPSEMLPADEAVEVAVQPTFAAASNSDTGLQPLDLTDSTATDRVLRLPAGVDHAQLSDLGGGLLRWHSSESEPTFEQVDFRAPRGVLKIDAGAEGEVTISTALWIDAELQIDAGTIYITGGSVTTGASDQFYNGAVVLRANATFNGRNVTFQGDVASDEVEPRSLTVNSSSDGVTRFEGSLGIIGPGSLSSLTTNADGHTEIGGDIVLAAGSAVFNDPVRLIRDVSISASGDSATTVRFGTTVDSESGSSFDLRVASDNFVVFQGAVGAESSLDRFVANANSISISNSVQAKSVALNGLDSVLLNGPDAHVSTGAYTVNGDLGRTVLAGSYNQDRGSSVTATGPISITARDVSLGGTLAGTDSLTIIPSPASASIGLGGSAGEFRLDDFELSNLVDGFTSITIRSAGLFDIDTATFLDPVTIFGAAIHDNLGLDIRNHDAENPSVTLGGNVSPGQSPGVLEVERDVTLASGGRFTVEIGGTIAGAGAGFHDQLSAAGSITIADDVTLVTRVFDAGRGGDFVPADGDQFVIMSNGGTGVAGTFAGLPEGALLSSNFFGSDLAAYITYVGGDGNDVVIFVDAPPRISTNSSGQTVDDNDSLRPFRGVSITDASAALTVIVTLSGGDAGGILNNFTQTAPGTYRLTEAMVTAAEAQAALRSLVFYPQENQVPVGQLVTTTFTIEVNDGTNPSVFDSATRVTTTSINSAPTAIADNYTAVQHEPLLVSDAEGVGFNDYDLDPETKLTVSDADAFSAAGARVSVNANGGFIYDPTVLSASTLRALLAGQTFADTFTYTVTDGVLESDVATVTISVTGVNAPPDATLDLNHVTESAESPPPPNTVGKVLTINDPQIVELIKNPIFEPVGPLPPAESEEPVMSNPPDEGSIVGPREDFFVRTSLVATGTDVGEPVAIIVDVTGRNGATVATAEAIIENEAADGLPALLLVPSQVIPPFAARPAATIVQYGGAGLGLIPAGLSIVSNSRTWGMEGQPANHFAVEVASPATHRASGDAASQAWNNRGFTIRDRDKHTDGDDDPVVALTKEWVPAVDRRDKQRMDPVVSAVLAVACVALVIPSQAVASRALATAASSTTGGTLVVLGSSLSAATATAAQAVTNPLLALLQFLLQITGLAKILAACVDFYRRRKKRRRRSPSRRDLGNELDELANGLRG